MHLPIRMLFVSAALLFLPPSVTRGDIIYQVTELTTASFSVTGTITTDGTLGSASLGNVVSSNLAITNGAMTQSLNFIQNFDTIATATELRGAGGGNFQGTFGLTPNFFDYNGATDNLQITLNGVTENRVLAGPNPLLATGGATVGAAVPEPSGLALLLGLGCFAIHRSRRSLKARGNG